MNNCTQRMLQDCSALALSTPQEDRHLLFCTDTRLNQSYAPYLDFLFYLSRSLDPELIVEFGVSTGRSLAFLCSGAPGARVIGVDVEECQGLIPEYLAPYHNYNLHLGLDSVGWMKAWRGSWGGPMTTIDLMHIDTDHEFDQTVNELRAAALLISPGGVICLDDSDNVGGVKAAIQSTWPIFDAVGCQLMNLNELHFSGYSCILFPGE